MSAVNSQWYWVDRGTQKGPVSWQGLLSLAKAGKVRPTDLVLREGSQTWQPASTAKDVDNQPSSSAQPVAPRAMPQFNASNVIPDDSEESNPVGGGVNIKRMLFGAALCGGGVILSVLGHDAAVARGGGHYTVYTGAIIWGIILFFRSFGSSQ